MTAPMARDPRRCLLAAAVILAAGCSGRAVSKYAALLVPAAGRVTIGGQPLAAAALQFIPIADGIDRIEALAFTDADGRYRAIASLPNTDIRRSMGMVPGRYRVVVEKLVMPDGGPVPEGVGDSEALARGAKSTVPAPYRNVGTTPLVVDVPAGGADSLDLEIKR